MHISREDSGIMSNERELSFETLAIHAGQRLTQLSV